jgi:hypothetical protein
MKYRIILLWEPSDQLYACYMCCGDKQKLSFNIEPVNTTPAIVLQCSWTMVEGSHMFQVHCPLNNTVFFSSMCHSVEGYAYAWAVAYHKMLTLTLEPVWTFNCHCSSLYLEHGGTWNRVKGSYMSQPLPKPLKYCVFLLHGAFYYKICISLWCCEP